jgi:hypothetical protein
MHKWTSQQPRQSQSLSWQSVRTSHNEAFAGLVTPGNSHPVDYTCGLRGSYLVGLRIPDPEANRQSLGKFA